MKQKLLGIAEVIDGFRVIPRVMMAGYGYLVFVVADWFMALPDPTGTQMGFISTLLGIAGMMTGWYLSTGRKWDDK